MEEQKKCKSNWIIPIVLGVLSVGGSIYAGYRDEGVKSIVGLAIVVAIINVLIVIASIIISSNKNKIFIRIIKFVGFVLSMIIGGRVYDELKPTLVSDWSLFFSLLFIILPSLWLLYRIFVED